MPQDQTMDQVTRSPTWKLVSVATMSPTISWPRTEGEGEMRRPVWVCKSLPQMVAQRMRTRVWPGSIFGMGKASIVSGWPGARKTAARAVSTGIYIRLA